MQTSRAEHGSYSEIIRDEVDKILRYLDSRRPDTPGETLHVYFLFSADLLQELRSVLKQQDSVRYHFSDLHENVSHEPVSNPFSDAYFMQQLLRLRPGNVYAGVCGKALVFPGQAARRGCGSRICNVARPARAGAR